MTQLERIGYYESLMERLERAVAAAEEAAAPTGEAASLAAELEAYYAGPEWREDFDADEAGQLPPELRRGVLSEDGVWNLLERVRAIRERGDGSLSS